MVLNPARPEERCGSGSLIKMKEDIMKRLDLDESQVSCIDDPVQIRYLNCVAYPSKSSCDFVMEHQNTTNTPDVLIIPIVLMAVCICLMSGYLLRQCIYTPVSTSLVESEESTPYHEMSDDGPGVGNHGSIRSTDVPIESYQTRTYQSPPYLKRAAVDGWTPKHDGDLPPPGHPRP